MASSLNVEFPSLHDLSARISPVLAAGFVLVGFLAYNFLYSGPLGSVPGPFLARFPKLWLLYHTNKGDIHRVTTDLHEKYGPIVRLSSNEVSVNSSAAVKKIYGAGSKFRKANWYSVWQGRRKFDIFPERDEKIHGAQRRLVSRVYSMEALKENEQCVDATISVYLNKLESMAGKPVNMSLWNQLFAFDVIGEATFSERFGYLDSGKDDGAFAQIDRTLISASRLGFVPWVYWLDEFFTPYIGSHLGIAARHGSLRTFAAAQVDARVSRGSDKPDLLTKFLSIHQAKPDDFDQTNVLSMTATNINAGSDSTAVSLSSVVYHLCKYPRAKQKLMDEIEQQRKEGNIGSSISMDVALKMPYLQACIQEGLRMWPAVGMSMPRVVPDEGVEIEGTYLPGGTVVGANAWAVHRNKDIFGEDAEEFRPERWLLGDKGEMERNFLAFGAGSRTCLGRHLSWMEMSKVVPLMFLHYDVQLVDPEAALDERCHWFVKVLGFEVVLKPRNLD